jgi:hypothetical protein
MEELGALLTELDDLVTQHSQLSRDIQMNTEILEVLRFLTGS